MNDQIAKPESKQFNLIADKKRYDSRPRADKQHLHLLCYQQEKIIDYRLFEL